MANNDYVSVYLRTSVNSAGLHYVPGPTLEARQKSNLNLNIYLFDLSSGKEPINLPGLGVFDVRFIVRKHKYPASGADILIDEECIWVEGGKVNVSLTSDQLNLHVTNYWYDILISADSFSPGEKDIAVRSPLGVFKVVQ